MPPVDLRLAPDGLRALQLVLCEGGPGEPAPPAAAAEVVLGLQVGLPELGIGSHQQEYVFLVDCHKHFAYGQALNPSVDEVFGDSLALNRKPLKGMQSVLQRAAYALVN